MCPKLESEISEARKPLSEFFYLRTTIFYIFLDIMSTFGIFLILIIGLSVAGLVFILEWIFKLLWTKIQRLPRVNEQRHLAEPWGILAKAKSFYVNQQPMPIFTLNQRALTPRWWGMLNSGNVEKEKYY